MVRNNSVRANPGQWGELLSWLVDFRSVTRNIPNKDRFLFIISSRESCEAGDGWESGDGGQDLLELLRCDG